MIASRNRKIIIRTVALIGVIINAVYAIGLLQTLFDPLQSDLIKEISISAIALEFSWAALLIWVMLKPYEHHYLLLFTAIPIVFANFLHSMNQLINQHSEASMIILNLSIGFCFASIFVYAFTIARYGDR